MKRLTPPIKVALLKHLAKRARNADARRAKKLKRRADLVEMSIRHRQFAAQHNLRVGSDTEREPIMLPEVLSLRTNYEETVGTIIRLRELVLNQNTRVMLYFDKVRELEPAATLALISEIYRCRHLRPGGGRKIVSGNYPKNTNVFFQLSEMGFYDLIGVKDTFKAPEGKDLGVRPYFIRFRTFKGVVPEFAAAFCKLTMDGTFKMGELALGRMTGALKEAMGNSLEHAYVETTPYQPMKGRWWVTGYIDPANHEMMITFFDQGIGVPKRLGVELFDFVKAAVLHRTWGISDGYMIAAATELHRTSAAQDLGGRGKGFRDMKKFVDTCDDGELRVFSDKGSYCYTNKGDHITDSKVSLGGTLIEWRVKHASTLEVE